MTLLLALALTAHADVGLDPHPTVGGETVVTVTDDLGEPVGGATVRVVHRPGLAAERELAIGITDARGRVRWTPGQGGVARIRAGEEVHPVRIDAAGPPPATAVLLGLIAFAGLFGLGYGLHGGRLPRRGESR